MDVPLVVLFALALIWILFAKSRQVPVPFGVPTATGIIVAGVVAVDWFFGRRAILGHPDGLFHTLFKMALFFAVVITVGSGLTSVLVAKNRTAVLLSIIGDVLVLALLLNLMGAWSFRKPGP